MSDPNLTDEEADVVLALNGIAVMNDTPQRVSAEDHWRRERRAQCLP